MQNRRQNIPELCIFCFFISLFTFVSYPQAADHDKYISTAEYDKQNRYPIEKLQIIHDRYLYLEGDTILLKIINMKETDIQARHGSGNN